MLIIDISIRDLPFYDWITGVMGYIQANPWTLVLIIVFIITVVGVINIQAGRRV